MLPPKKKKTCYAIPANTKYIPIYTYVNRAYRGMAIGKRLLKRAAGFTTSQRKRNRYKPTVFFWNEKSSAFFARMQESLPRLQIYDVEEWWDLYDY